MADAHMQGVTRWERRKELTHARLVEVGDRLFREQGFDATTVEEIAAASDVAKGTFFNYFPSKEALLGEILYERTQSLLASLPVGDAPASEQIWHLLRAIRSELAPYTSLFPRMFAYVLTNPAVHTTAEEHESLSAAIARLISVGQGRGEFRREADAEMAGTLLATYFFRLCMLETVCEQQNGSPWDVQMEAVLDLLYIGLKPTATEHHACC